MNNVLLAPSCRCTTTSRNIALSTGSADHFHIPLDTPPRSRPDLTGPPDTAALAFSLRKGESFIVEGLLAELDAAHPDCGRPPHFFPSGLVSQCYTRFREIFNFSDLERGERGETIAVNVSDSAMGGDSCAWQVKLTIDVR